MYNAGHQDFVRMAPDDQLSIRRYNLSLLHQYRISNEVKYLPRPLPTTARNWRRQDFISNPADNAKPANWTGVTWETIPLPVVQFTWETAQAIATDSFAKLQVFKTGLDGNYKFLNMDHEWKGRVRYIYEKADEQRINGTLPAMRHRVHLPRDEDRLGHALRSAYVQQSTKYNQSNLPWGLGFENFEYENKYLEGHSGLATRM